MVNLLSNPYVVMLYRIIPAILIIAANEIVKARISTKLMDKLPAATNRLTLNPFKHLDVIGLGFMVWFGYGFGKPVETSPLRYKDRNKGTIIVYTMPILFLFALGIALFYLNVLISQMVSQHIFPEWALYFCVFLMVSADLSVRYAIMNIIPIYPMNGVRVLTVFLKPQSVVKIAQYEKVMQILLVFAIIFGWLDYIVNPIIKMLFGL